MEDLNNKVNLVEKIRRFLARTADEVKRCTWPGRDELMESTILVLIVLTVSTLFIVGVDQILYYIITWLTSL